MNCPRARQLLTSSRTPDVAARRHLRTCDDCAQFAQRLATIETSLSEHQTLVVAPDGFADRIRAQLPREEDMLGWAAIRLLPATLAVVVLLSWLNLRGAGGEEALEVDPTGAVLTWILDPPVETKTGS